MTRMTIDELHRELEATDETYVRRKVLIDGYSSIQKRQVQAWLAQRDTERAEQRTALNLAITSRNVFWNMVGAFGGVGGALVTIATLIATKAG